MKCLWILPLVVLISCGKNEDVNSTISNTRGITEVDSTLVDEDMDSSESVMTPQQELDYFTEFEALGKATAFRFAQSSWNECKDIVTGNYVESRCSTGRKISVILQTFMNNHMHKCVSKGLVAQGGGVLADYHIVHAGIFGDPRHSPRSLHAENRAIDIKSFEVLLTSGTSKVFVYAGTKNRSFFTAFRNCWGDIIRQHNGCPVNKDLLRTGSIGWEDKNHQNHLHTSVPYCVANKYRPEYFSR